METTATSHHTHTHTFAQQIQRKGRNKKRIADEQKRERAQHAHLRPELSAHQLAAITVRQQETQKHGSQFEKNKKEVIKTSNEVRRPTGTDAYNSLKDAEKRKRRAI